MKIESVKVSDLKPYTKNARTHSPEQIKQIANSIKEFGFTNPILIDKSNELIAGHGRLEGAKSIGMTEVPCVRLGHLTDKQKRAYVLADNKIALNSGWDFEMLNAELEDLKLDFDMTDFGFEALKEFEFNPPSDKDPEEKMSEYFLIINCKNETIQKELFDEMNSRNIMVKVK